MPELPEVETIKRGLEKSLIGSVIKKIELRREGLRTPFSKDFAAVLAGKKITNISRRAKYLLFFLGDDDVLIAHLGMTGKFLSVSDKEQAVSKHDHAVFYLTDGNRLIYNDTRRFGLMELCKERELKNHKLLKNLAPEPLEADFTVEYVKQALAGRKAPIKPVIMDQKIAVGVGNIYASEALFTAGISPLTPANQIDGKIPLFIDCIRKVLNDAIKAGGSTLRDFAHVSGEAGYFQHNFSVYGRAGEACRRCGSKIVAIRQAGRATFYCPKCQK